MERKGSLFIMLASRKYSCLHTLPLFYTLLKDTSRDVVINDVALSSLNTPEWSQLVFCDVFVTILVWSLWWCHICSSVTKLVFSS
jgi:hypothetical protein